MIHAAAQPAPHPRPVSRERGHRPRRELAPVALIGRNRCTQDDHELGPPDDDHLHLAVLRVIHYLHDHLADPITADQIAEKAQFSKFHFARVFQRITGESPGRYLTNLRFRRAAHLLVTTNLRVIDIAHEVGFSSVGTFSTRFRERVGISPSEYRRQLGTSRRCALYERPLPGRDIA